MIQSATKYFYITLKHLGVDPHKINVTEVHHLVCLAEYFGVHHPGVFGFFDGNLVSKSVDQSLLALIASPLDSLDSLAESIEIRPAVADKLKKANSWYDQHGRNPDLLAAYCICRQMLAHDDSTKTSISNYIRNHYPDLDTIQIEAILNEAKIDCSEKLPSVG